jgi:hypothetical protein
LYESCQLQLGIRREWPVTNITNPDGTSGYSNDANGQMMVVDHSHQADEAYSYDADEFRVHDHEQPGDERWDVQSPFALPHWLPFSLPPPHATEFLNTSLSLRQTNMYLRVDVMSIVVVT